MTMISRVLGLVRDMVFAYFFGVRGATDAFFVAFKIPNFLRRLFAEGAFAQAFVPVLSETKSQHGHAGVRDLVAHVSGVLGLGLLGVSVLGVIGAPILIIIFGGGFLTDPDGERFSLGVDMLRLTFPYLFFISMTALLSGILNTYQQFVIPALTPVFLNLILIIATVGVSVHLTQPVMALAGGVFVAGIVQLGFQLPAVIRLGLLPVPRWDWHHAGVKKIRQLMLPAIMGSSVVQVSLLLDTLMASFLVAGSVTWIYFSDRLVELPLGLFGVALSTVILPSLAQHHVHSDARQFHQLLDWAMRWAVLVSIPATVGLVVLAGPILTTLFGYGEFMLRDVEMSRLSLMAYALGLPAFIMIKVFAPGFFSRQDTKTPVKAAVYAIGVNIVLKLVFVGVLLGVTFNGAHMGLAAATSLAAYVNCILLYRWLRRDGVYALKAGWGVLGLRVLIASAGMGLILWFFVADLAQWYQWAWPIRVKNLVLGLLGGVAGFIAIAVLLGLRPLHFTGPRPDDQAA